MICLDPFDEIMLKSYFNMNTIFQSLQRYKKRLRTIFYSQNMSTHIEYGELGIVTRGFRPDREVEKLLDCMDLVDKRFNRYVYRDRHFNNYLDSLSPNECNLLCKAFKSADVSPILPRQLIDQTIDEIYEIESSLCFREGIDPGELERIELVEDVDENLERMCDFFAL
ncbi:hypothetical protein ACYSNU_04900 [Enterococcus sp. LJL120]